MNVEKNIVEQYKRILSINDLDKQEELAFTTSSGENLNLLSRIRREFIKIDTVFTYDSGESLDFVNSKNIRCIIDDLSCAIDNIEKYDIESIQKVIIILQMFLEIDVSFYKLTIDLVNNNQLVENVVNLPKQNFEIIYNKVNMNKKRWK